MLDDLKNQLSLIRVLIILGIIALASYIFDLYWQLFLHFSDVLVILLVSWLLSFILEPVVLKIHSWTKLHRIWATIIAYLLLTSGIGILVFIFMPEITRQINIISGILPNYLETAPTYIKTSGNAVASYMGNSINYIPSVAQFFLSFFIVIILSFYFVVDKERISKEIMSFIPNKWHNRVEQFQSIIDSTFASFLRIQVFYGIAMGILTWIVLAIFGIEFAASSAFISGILAAIPMIGPLLAFIPPITVTFIEEPNLVIIVGVILFVIQQVVFNVVGPKLLGNALKVHPVLVLVAFLLGFKVAGVLGALLAIPLLGISAVMVREFRNPFVKK